MFKNYIKTALRSLGKNKGFTAINLLGLALGLAITLLIVFYVVDELGYDRYNTKADRIYRINNDIKLGSSENSYAVSPAILASALTAEIPEIDKVVRFRQSGSPNIKKGNQIIHENNTVYADPSVFDVFTLPSLSGDLSAALKEPNTVVITETIAKKYFNTVSVVGKTMVFDDTHNFKITGVIKDVPKQSHFNFDFFISMASLAESRDNSWLSNNFQTYILLKNGADIKTVDKKLQQLIIEHLSPQLQTTLHLSYADFNKGGNYFRLNTTPLTDIHLHSNRVAEVGQNGNIQYVYIFSIIAIFILLIACVNFMNLSTARSANRAREVGVRKVLGSDRKHLIFQFLAESMIVTFVSTLIALVLAILLLPLFNQMADKELGFTFGSLTWLIPAVIVIILVIGLLAGSYPAFFLSGFQPIAVLKGKLAEGFKGGGLRSFLVVFQFSISIFLIIGTLVIYNQLKFIQNKDLGYNRSQVLVIKNVMVLGQQANTFKQEVKSLPGVTNGSLTSYTPTGMNRNSSAIFPDATFDTKKALVSQIWSVDEDYIATLNIKLLQGRNFSKDMPTDSSAIIVNQSAAKLLGFQDPLNKTVYTPQDSYGKYMKPYRIIGMIKDFNFNSLRENVSPLVLIFKEERGALNLKVNPANVAGIITQIQNKWKAIAPNQDFSYSFMDQDFDATYRSEQRIAKIFLSFTSLAIIIACLGLFGLAAYAAEQRTKEIGVRKVLGAGLSSIVGMLSKDFIKLVLIAILIAAPLAWLAMRQWLQGFAYRQNVQWWVIVVAGAGAILIAFVTISFQSIKAALINPVKSLEKRVAGNDSEFLL